MNTEKTVPAQGYSPQACALPIVRGRRRKTQRVVIYGPEGVGKSTLAAGLPAPLFLDTEEGTLHLDADRLHVETVPQMREACRTIFREAKAGSLPYKTVVIDTGDRLWDMCAQEVTAAAKVESIEAIGYGKGYAQASEMFVSLLAMFDALRSAGLHVAVVCHSRVETVSPPDSEAYTMYTVKVNAPAKQAATAKDKLREWADAVLFCNFVTVVTDAGKAKGGTCRKVYTEHRATWEAKNRHGMDPVVEMTPEALAPIFADFEVPAVPIGQMPAPDVPDAPEEPEANSPKDLGFDHELVADEDALLVEYFVHVNRLKPGQSLEDLPAQVKAALAARRAGALEKARAWKGGLA